MPSDSKTAVARHKFEFTGINNVANRQPFGVGRELSSFRGAVFCAIIIKEKGNIKVKMKVRYEKKSNNIVDDSYVNRTCRMRFNECN